ncbi:MAG: hypothetical protein WCT19_01620 [Candidatus Paceibacterota bacterium]
MTNDKLIDGIEKGEKMKIKIVSLLGCLSLFALDKAGFNPLENSYVFVSMAMVLAIACTFFPDYIEKTIR